MDVLPAFAVLTLAGGHVSCEVHRSEGLRIRKSRISI